MDIKVLEALKKATKDLKAHQAALVGLVGELDKFRSEATPEQLAELEAASKLINMNEINVSIVDVLKKAQEINVEV